MLNNCHKVPATLILSCTTTTIPLSSLQLLKAETKPHCSKNYIHKMEEKERICKKRGMKTFLCESTIVIQYI